ncbi:hypothetical protein [Streptomyces chryseus]|nr:hypothetical protein [Streptomyces chryseus]GGX41006.1 hypothetical protein GCM10010353_65490 [Streptomyces chryseus]
MRKRPMQNLRRLSRTAVFSAVRGAAYAGGAAAVAGLGWWVDKIFFGAAG